jgi:phosphoesterase RecJ-like protein
MEIFYEYNAALIAIPWKDLVRYEIKTGDTEGLSIIRLSIQGIRMAALIIDRDEEVKCSFRSKGSFDVNALREPISMGAGTSTPPAAAARTRWK